MRPAQPKLGLAFLRKEEIPFSQKRKSISRNFFPLPFSPFFEPANPLVEHTFTRINENPICRCSSQTKVFSQICPVLLKFCPKNETCREVLPPAKFLVKTGISKHTPEEGLLVFHQQPYHCKQLPEPVCWFCFKKWNQQTGLPLQFVGFWVRCFLLKF